MSAIEPGTPCFLTGLTEQPEFGGRAVTVTAGPLYQPDAPGDWYAIEASWISELFPGRGALALRGNLIPLLPPSIAPQAASDRKPEPVE